VKKQEKVLNLKNTPGNSPNMTGFRPSKGEFPPKTVSLPCNLHMYSKENKVLISC